MYRDKSLLDLAQDQECLLNISRRCLTIEGSTTVSCHENSLEAGKGMGLKADDSRTVWGCYYCHALLDQGMLERDVLRRAFDRAYVLQIQEWIKVAQSITIRPWKVEAARRVLDHIGVPYE